MEKLIVDFRSPDERNKWENINDTVMGGISSSRMSGLENNAALFQGNVSLENNGGFASMRTHPREFDLNGCNGLMVKVKGDGKNYRLRLRTGDAYEGIAYQAVFPTEQDQWTTARLLFDQFQPVFRGRVVEDASPLDLTAVQRIGVMIADKQDGPFRLEIQWVKAYS